MALKAVPESPYQPQPVTAARADSPTVERLARWTHEQTQSVWRAIKDLAYRVNRTLPKDGSEPMTGTLDLGTPGKVKFPATQSASADTNTLDDYEEGTFTPTVGGSTTAGTYTYTGNQIGWYTKIGDRVFFSFDVEVNTVTTAGTGNARIFGLPFSGLGQNPVPVGFANVIAVLPANFGGWTGNVTGTAFVVRFFSTSNGVSPEANVNIFGASTRFIAGGWYRVAT